MWKEQYERWINYPDLDNTLKKQLEAMNEKELEDAFYRDLEFGTAGMRGIMGPGCNRMNIYMIRKVNTGFAQYIESKGEKAKEMGVAIAFDNRHNSAEFALESAKILASHDINVYLFSSLRPTPELSFAIRTLGCFGGIVCTASHNPKEYNGYKLYDEKGSQLVPGIIEPIITNINNIKDELTIKIELSEAQEKRIKTIDKEIDDKYIETLKTIQFHPDNIKDVSIIFTPQHGTSLVNMSRLFDETGYNYIVVEEQATPDPNFTHTLVPNPEDPKAYILALEYAKRYNADIVLSTDPDADRMGVQVKHEGEYVFLTGNQTGALLIEYICSNLKAANRFPENGLVVSTVVTNDLGTKIAESYGAEVVLALTGFKFIAERINQHCDNGDKNFIFGYEESYGSIVADFVRDKDSLQACLILAEAANYYKKKGKTLVDVINELYDIYGFYYDFQENIMLPGADGTAYLQTILKELRRSIPLEFGGLKVIKSEDYGILKRYYDGISEDIKDFVTSDVLKYFLEDGSWVAVRPSGTEPKCKFYYCVIAKDLAEAKRKTAQIKKTLDELIK